MKRWIRDMVTDGIVLVQHCRSCSAWSGATVGFNVYITILYSHIRYQNSYCTYV